MVKTHGPTKSGISFVHEPRRIALISIRASILAASELAAALLDSPTSAIADAVVRLETRRTRGSYVEMALHCYAGLP
jgi:hypothetical protein